MTIYSQICRTPRLFYGVPAAVEACRNCPLIIRTLLDLLRFRRTAGRLRRVEIRLAYGPAVACITIIVLLLFVLTHAGIDKHLVHRRRRLADLLLRGVDDDVTISPVGIVDLVGIVVGDAAEPDRRVVRGQEGNEKSDRRHDHGKARSLRAVPGASGEVVTRAAVNHHLVVVGQCPDELTAGRVGAVVVIS